MKKWIKLLGNALMIASVLFIIHFFLTMDVDYAMLCKPEVILFLIPGSVICLCAVFLLGLAWSRTLLYFSTKRIPKTDAVAVYAKANIGKYLPGNVMHYVERNLFAGEYGLGQLEIGMSSVLEIITQLAAAIILCLIFSWERLVQVFLERFSVLYVTILVGAGILAVVLLFVMKRKNKKIAYLLSEMKKIAFVKLFLGNIMLAALAMFLIASVLLGVLWSLGASEVLLGQIPLVYNTYILAWCVGFMVPGAPGGMGVRELVILQLIPSGALQNFLLVAVVIHRLITVLGDVLGYVWSMIRLKHVKNEENKQEE